MLQSYMGFWDSFKPTQRVETRLCCPRCSATHRDVICTNCHKTLELYVSKVGPYNRINCTNYGGCPKSRDRSRNGLKYKCHCGAQMDGSSIKQYIVPIKQTK